MAQAIRSTRRLDAWRFARTAIREYEREQNPSSSRQVELAMRYLRETQARTTQEAQERVIERDAGKRRL